MSSSKTPARETDTPSITIGETVAGAGSGDRAAGDPATLPVEEVLQGRGAIFGKSGSGKSNTVSVVVEELLAAEYPVLIFDADGEYVSLKEEFRVLHVGGAEYCEQVIGPDHAPALAKIGIEQREPIIVDLSGYAEHAADAGEDQTTRDDMVAAITSAFFEQAGQAKREYGGNPYLLVVEEMHEFVPQQGGLTASGRRLIKVAKRGRKRGLGISGLSQRPADVDKSFITQCDWLVWHRLTWDNDTDVVRSILGSTYGDAVSGLDDGEAFLMTDWDDSVSRVQMRRRQTTDLGQAPGLSGTAKMDLKETDTSLLDELDAASAEARTKQQRIAQLEDRVEDLQAERDEWQERYEDAEYIAEVGAEVQAAQQPNAQQQTLPETVTIDVGDGALEIPETIRAEVLDIRQSKREAEAELEAVREERDELRSERDSLQERVDDLEGRLEASDQLRNLRDDIAEAIDRNADAFNEEVPVTGPPANGDTAPDPTPSSAPSESPTDVGEASLADLIEHPEIRHAVDVTAEGSKYSHQWFARAMEILSVADDSLDANEVARLTDVTAGTMRPVLQELSKTGVVESSGSNPERFGLDREVLERRIRLSR